MRRAKGSGLFVLLPLQDFKRRIDLIQAREAKFRAPIASKDFEFNVASSRVRISADGQHVLATGIYAPDGKDRSDSTFILHRIHYVTTSYAFLILSIISLKGIY